MNSSDAMPDRRARWLVHTYVHKMLQLSGKGYNIAAGSALAPWTITTGAPVLKQKCPCENITYCVWSKKHIQVYSYAFTPEKQCKFATYKFFASEGTFLAHHTDVLGLHAVACFYKLLQRQSTSRILPPRFHLAKWCKIFPYTSKKRRAVFFAVFQVYAT